MRTYGMSPARFVLVGSLGALATLWATSCQGPQEFFRDSGIVTLGTGGIVSTGGQGASPSTGGVNGTGGIVIVGTGGVATGGITGTGGKATGGVTGTGGVATGGITGTGGKATGGITGTGGVATGGITGTGGVATGGITGTGGVATGGITGAGGGAAGSTGTAKNCVDAIAMAGYSATGAQPCSACLENGADKSTNCKKVIDCLDTNYPCGSASNCALQCNNSGGADSIVSACVNALLTAGSCVQP
jgi:hypothetical protein